MRDIGQHFAAYELEDQDKCYGKYLAKDCIVCQVDSLLWDELYDHLLAMKSKKDTKLAAVMVVGYDYYSPNQMLYYKRTSVVLLTN